MDTIFEDFVTGYYVDVLASHDCSMISDGGFENKYKKFLKTVPGYIPYNEDMNSDENEICSQINNNISILIKYLVESNIDKNKAVNILIKALLKNKSMIANEVEYYEDEDEEDNEYFSASRALKYLIKNDAIVSDQTIFELLEPTDLHKLKYIKSELFKTIYKTTTELGRKRLDILNS